jgi:hypothetical protein
MIGQALSLNRIIDEIGRGVDLRLARELAAKILPFSAATSPEVFSGSPQIGGMAP